MDTTNSSPPLNKADLRFVKLIRYGTYGNVGKYKVFGTKRVVEVLKTEKNSEARRAIEKIKQLDVDKCNLEKFIAEFEVGNHAYLVSELLEWNLFEYTYMIQRLDVCEMRVVAHQMLLALEALRNIGVVHCDITRCNIMLVNHESQPCRVRLVNFSSAREVGTLNYNDLMNSQYRAPEIILDLPLDESVDMWALGMVLANTYLKRRICHRTNEYAEMKTLVGRCGIPPDEMLNASRKTKIFFTHDSDGKWIIKTLKQYKRASRKYMHRLHGRTRIKLRRIMRHLDHCMPPAEHEDREKFMDLLEEMLQPDPKNRITPSEALRHDFITMKHLPDKTAQTGYAVHVHNVRKRCKMEEEDDNSPANTTCRTDIAVSGNDVPPSPSTSCSQRISRFFSRLSYSTAQSESQSPKDLVKPIQATKFKSSTGGPHLSGSPKDQTSAKHKKTNQTTTVSGNEGKQKIKSELLDSPSATKTTGQNSGFVEVKSTGKFQRRIHKLFSGTSNSVSCCTEDTSPADTTCATNTAVSHEEDTPKMKAGLHDAPPSTSATKSTGQKSCSQTGSGFVEVKNKRKFLKRIHTFFS